MLKSERTTATGKVNIVVRDKNGKVKEDFTVPNLVVNTGLAFIASRMEGVDDTIMSHMAVGTDNTAAAAGNTTLGTELARVTCSGTASGANMVYTSEFGAGTGNGSLTEAGIFNASSGGTMLCRTVFAVINKGLADTMTVTWTITIS
ncbi:hypothetical protein N9H34_01730 [bacterium]|nr:hypothetical protein [bacterium]